MPAIDLSILNQRQTPAFYADTLANRPSAGFIGRIFVSTDTFAFYRDNGTTWDLIGGPGTGTITGSGAAGQVSFWNGASTITGNNDLFWDNVNGHLGIGTNVPGTALQIDHDQNQFIRLNQTTATNDTKIAFQNSGVALWRIGNSYNAGANDFGIYDVVGAIQPVTVKKTTGQVLIGTSTVGSGKLVVASATSDNGVQIVGASAPSLRIDNAESGPTKRAGLGISTAANNFIQGSADRDFCMFNGSTTASPILFGIYGTTNVVEAARISAARNLLVGTSVDGGYKLSINGTGYINDRLTIDGTSGGQYIQFYNSGVDRAHIYWEELSNSLSIGTYIAGGSIQFEIANNVDAMLLNSSGNLGIGVTPSSWSNFKVIEFANGIYLGTFLGGGQTMYLGANNYFDGSDYIYKVSGYATRYQQTSGNHGWFISTISGTAGNIASFNQAMTLATTGNLLIGTTTDAGQKLQVAGAITSNGDVIGGFIGLTIKNNNSGTNASQLSMQTLTQNWYVNVRTDNHFSIFNATAATTPFIIKTTGVINLPTIPTSAAGLVSGDIYSNLGILTIVP